MQAVRCLTCEPERCRGEPCLGDALPAFAAAAAAAWPGVGDAATDDTDACLASPPLRCTAAAAAVPPGCAPAGGSAANLTGEPWRGGLLAPAAAALPPASAEGGSAAAAASVLRAKLLWLARSWVAEEAAWLARRALPAPPALPLC